MELLYPIGLLAAAGIVVPLLIHLWKINQGRVLKIGNISLLGLSSRKSSKSFKLTDWLLFLLRCLLILLLALLIAKPVLKKVFEPGKQQGWVLIDQSDFPFVYKENKATMDSLLQQGYEIHDFNIGFKQLGLQDTLGKDSSIVASPGLHTALLKQLNASLPENYRVYLYSDRRVNQLGEDLAHVSFDLQHRLIKRTDTLSSWTTSSYGKTFEAKSSPTSTRYESSRQDTGSISILLYENGYPEDRLYLEAAVKAISSFTDRKILLQRWSKAKFEQLKPDLVFWLTDQPLDPLLKTAWKTNAAVFSYAQGKTQKSNSFIAFKEEATAGGGDAIALYKRIPAPENQVNALWTDGYGDPLLSLEKNNGLNEYKFYARLNPQWTNLVWNEQFVKRMMPLVIGAATPEVDFGFENHAADQRWLPMGQEMALSAKNTIKAERLDWKEPIGPTIWIFALIVFVLERLLSIRNKNKSAA